MTLYRCPQCGYVQDFEPTEANQKKHFKKLFPKLKKDECPGCQSQMNVDKKRRKEPKFKKLGKLARE